ncbi:putative C2H2 finger domain protein [Aspergillus saccharolyticus JOP 1030-1]|uniref:C2H2 finger domain protein n=1 Tax=Aspergillus saccharolyticus JOP 1030-1 TaxID=1450539 RepID=A0A318ZK96_9EURO|nr:hypothetical protein BP01DRAFT_353901 [Aspergillus saccharolyticus JOP 1030-1]PYH48011.1 hypothetical protein BP01DRAFT_353901 [Aspergillus saccharolyticus JOP 1030-1]
MDRFTAFSEIPQLSSGVSVPQDYELYPGEYESSTDPTMSQHPSSLQSHLPSDTLPMKGLYPPTMPWTSTAEEINALTPGFASPWSSEFTSSPALESPKMAHTNWTNIGCYMSPPYSCDDVLMSPSVYDPSASPAMVDYLVTPSQVYPEPEPMVKVEPELATHVFAFPAGFAHGGTEFMNGTSACGQSVKQEEHVACDSPKSQVKTRKAPKTSTGRIGKRPRKPSNKTSDTANARASSKMTAKRGVPAPSRLYTCSFSHYGCPSTFVSKNEWKRHVISQHIQLGFFRCDVGRCSLDSLSKERNLNSPFESLAYNESHLVNDFNRKDLFTQHQRRMHAPWLCRNRKTPETEEEREAFEQSLEAVRNRCWHEQRKAPLHSQCGFCGQHFVGARSWNDRMEHVGRHYEKDELLHESEDLLLRQWAIEEGIIREVEGEWKLAVFCDK